MEEKKYLNEEDYQRYTTKLKKIGKILLIVGLVLFILSIGLIVAGSITFGSTVVTENAGSALGGMGLFAVGGFLSVFSFGMAGIGGMILFIAHRREITAYTTQQVMPVAKETIDEMTPTMSKAAEKMAPAAGTVAKEITKGIKEGLKDEE
jgi:hypothetical protein